MNNTITRVFPVTDLACAACAARVENVLKQQKGVDRVSVNFANATARVEYNPAICNPMQLQGAVRNAGYDLIIDTTEDKVGTMEELQCKNYHSLKTRTLWAVILSLPVVVIGMVFMDMPYADLIMLLFSTPVVFWFGRQFYTGAWKQLCHHTANMDTLVASSTGIAWVFSVANMMFPEYWISKGIHPHVYFEAASVIIAFILIGRLMESRAKGHTSAAIKELMGLQPKTVIELKSDGTQAEVAVNAVRPGAILMAHPGERIAIDGKVSGGHSYVDESMLSGEPVPVEKKSGDEVFAGTINTTGTFLYVAEKTGEDTLLAKIIRMVQDAQGSKAPVQQLVNKIAAIFVPSIICIAVISFAIWMIADKSEGFSHGLLAAVTVLIIACPCALGLATPTAIMVGIGKGAEEGILIKDAEAIGKAPDINTIVLDKTGTLTKGKPVVTTVIHFRNPTHSDNILYSLELMSEHPLGKAITDHFNGLTPADISDFRSETGKGVSGITDGRRYFAGNRRFMDKNDISLTPEMLEKEKSLAQDANSIVWFADSDGVISMTGISDPIKPTSAKAVERLNKMGIEVWMLTGDNRKTAEAIAEKAGIRLFKAEVLPDEKSLFVAQLQSEGKKVAMVGDGINDSAALATSDLGIAMGTGSDIAIEVAGITIVSADLSRIPAALFLSKATVRTIRQNLFWAFIYNMVGVPVAAGILYPVNGFLLNPMIAGAAMALSSVSVVANSLRLKKKRFL